MTIWPTRRHHSHRQNTRTSLCASPCRRRPPLRDRRLPADRTGHGQGFHLAWRCLRYRVLPDQYGPGLTDAGPGCVQFAADGAQMGAKFVPVLLQPLLLDLRRPPGALEPVAMELIQLIVNLSDATLELLDLVFQADALLVQITEADRQPANSLGQFPGRFGIWPAHGDVLTGAAKPGHSLTLTPHQPTACPPRRRSATLKG